MFNRHVGNKIQAALVSGGTSCSAATPCQTRNVGEARVSDVELGLRGTVLPWLDLGGNLTLLDQKNLSNPDIRITGIPHCKLFAYGVVRPAAGVVLQATVEHNSRRWVNNFVTLAEFTLLGLKASWKRRGAGFAPG